RANANALANAAAHAPPATAAAVFAEDGTIEAITDPAHTALAQLALESSGGASMWVGAPDVAEGHSAPVIVRRIQGRAIVTIVNPELLLPDLATDARVIIAAPSGDLIYASPVMAGAGLETQQQVLSLAGANGGAALIKDLEGTTWAAAEALAQVGQLRVIAIGPAPTSLQLWIAAFLRFALVAAAPLAAIGVLYLLMRQSAQRARLAE